MDQKARNLEGLRAAGEDEDDAFGSLTATFADIQHSLDGNALVQVGDTTTLTLTGRGGKFTGSQTLEQLSVHTIPNLTTGKVVVVQTSGSWTPTCSLGEVNFLHAGGDHRIANLNSAQIGPEGYVVTDSGGTFEAHSSGHAFGFEQDIGTSVKFCQNTGLIGDAYGVNFEGCSFANQRVSFSATSTSGGGDEARSTASFATGLRLPSTPFPEAPVGSLLVVLGDPQSGTIRDVKVVHSGGTSILVPASGTAYFIVNDKRCDSADDRFSLTVTARTMTKQTDVADAALIGMADVLAYMRQKRLTWINRCHHRPRRVPLPPGSPGTTDPPTGHLPEARRGSQGAPQAPSAASLPSTAPAASGILCASTDPKRGRPPSTNVGTRACTMPASVGAGEEPSARHRVGPWSPVMPAILVPSFVGGDRRGRSMAPSQPSCSHVSKPRSGWA
jgi:hypothetical protein